MNASALYTSDSFCGSGRLSTAEYRIDEGSIVIRGYEANPHAEYTCASTREDVPENGR